MRDFISLVEALSASRTVYHFSPAEHLPEIQRQGLIPQIGPRSRKLGEPRPAIYFFPTLAGAEDALMNWLGDEFDEAQPIALLRVNIPADVEIQCDQTYGDEVHVFAPIPAQNIEILSQDAMSLAGLTQFR